MTVTQNFVSFDFSNPFFFFLIPFSLDNKKSSSGKKEADHSYHVYRGKVR